MRLTKVFYDIRRATQARNGDGSRKYKYILLTGSSRSSKTTSAIQNYYSDAWNESGKRFSVWRNEKKICKDTVGHDMKNIFPDMPYYSPRLVNFHKTESVYTFPSGSTIELCGTDDAEKIHGYNGDVLWLNEPYSISRETFDQLDQRTSDYVIIDMNPKMSHWSDDLQKDPRCIKIHSTFNDNPYCPEEQRRKILSYQTIKYADCVLKKLVNEHYAKKYDLVLNEKQLTQKQITELIRCIDNEEKNSANDFNWCVYGLGIKGERPNRIFKWNPIPESEYRLIDAPTYYGNDWGTVDPWAIVEAKYKDGNLYLHELNYLSENQWRERIGATELSQINASDAGKDDKTGIAVWLFNKLAVSRDCDVICDSNRPLKGQALRQAGYRAMPAPKLPGSIIDGIDLLNNLKVYYTSSSVNLEYEQENYSRKVDKYGVVEEEPEDLNNHCADCVRYIALYLQGKGIIKIV